MYLGSANEEINRDYDLNDTDRLQNPHFTHVFYHFIISKKIMKPKKVIIRK
jgi:hypothetical protein